MAAVAALAASLCMPALAAPVERGETPPSPDPYELAVRWTLASLSTAPATSGEPPALPSSGPVQRFSPLPHGLQGTAHPGVPDPGAYALMGLALLAAGLVARRVTATRRRGRSERKGGLAA